MNAAELQMRMAKVQKHIAKATWLQIKLEACLAKADRIRARRALKKGQKSVKKTFDGFLESLQIPNHGKVTRESRGTGTRK